MYVETFPTPKRNAAASSAGYRVVDPKRAVAIAVTRNMAATKEVVAHRFPPAIKTVAATSLPAPSALLIAPYATAESPAAFTTIGAWSASNASVR